jgi:hypothetical protein
MQCTSMHIVCIHKVNTSHSSLQNRDDSFHFLARFGSSSGCIVVPHLLHTITGPVPMSIALKITVIKAVLSCFEVVLGDGGL